MLRVACRPRSVTAPSRRASGSSRGSRGGIAGAARRRAVVVCMYVWPKSIVCHATLKESRPDAAPRSRGWFLAAPQLPTYICVARVCTIRTPSCAYLIALLFVARCDRHTNFCLRIGTCCAVFLLAHARDSVCWTRGGSAHAQRLAGCRRGTAQVSWSSCKRATMLARGLNFTDVNGALAHTRDASKPRPRSLVRKKKLLLVL